MDIADLQDFKAIKVFGEVWNWQIKAGGEDQARLDKARPDANDGRGAKKIPEEGTSYFF